MNIKNNCYKVLLLRYPTLIALEFSEVRDDQNIFHISQLSEYEPKTTTSQIYLSNDV